MHLLWGFLTPYQILLLDKPKPTSGTVIRSKSFWVFFSESSVLSRRGALWSLEQLQVQLQLSADRFGQTDKLFVDSESQSLTCERGGWREGGCGSVGEGVDFPCQSCDPRLLARRKGCNSQLLK